MDRHAAGPHSARCKICVSEMSDTGKPAGVGSRRGGDNALQQLDFFTHQSASWRHAAVSGSLCLNFRSRTNVCYPQSTPKGAAMGKEQKSTKEKRKPKADKKPAASSTPSPFSSVTANQKASGGKKK